jgi:hypothetical protein
VRARRTSLKINSAKEPADIRGFGEDLTPAGRGAMEAAAASITSIPTASSRATSCSLFAYAHLSVPAYYAASPTTGAFPTDRCEGFPGLLSSLPSIRISASITMFPLLSFFFFFFCLKIISDPIFSKALCLPFIERFYFLLTIGFLILSRSLFNGTTRKTSFDCKINI